MRRRAAWALLALTALAARFSHLDIVWVEEAYPAAAAIQILHGKFPYRDFWFDKPPLPALVYLLWGAYGGWPLRLAGAAFVLLAAWLVYRLSRELWSEREGLAAASLAVFFLTFWIPSAVMALAPDLLMLVPHAAAVWMAVRGRAFASGLLAGLAFLVNPKGFFVAAACALWAPRGTLAIIAGFALPNLVAVGWLWTAGALTGYIEQVWRWGWLYSRNTFVQDPLREGLARTANWLGFHAALAAGAAVYWWRERDAKSRRMAGWLIISAVAVLAGWRFFPRYYFQLLPVMAIAGARGLTLVGSWRARVLVLALLAVPAVRFGPRYFVLAGDLLGGRPHAWSDLAMSDDSRRVAELLAAQSRPGDTLLVWGYRPDIFARTRLPAGTPYLDSQPLTGVIADRHLTRFDAAAPALAERSRRALVETTPTWIVDGIGLYNPKLAIPVYTDLKPWLGRYQPLERTAGSVVYRLTAPSARSR